MSKRRQSTVELHGHRGARGLTPENTLASFREALRHDVDWIEIDVGMTKDGAVVIHHDPGLNPAIARLAGEWVDHATPLKDLTRRELRAYDVGRLRPGSHYAQVFYRQVPTPGECIPALDDLLLMPELADAKHVGLNIEIKTFANRPDASFAPEVISDALIKNLKAHKYCDRVRIQSFDWRNLVHIQKCAPAIPLGFLTTGTWWRDDHAADVAVPPAQIVGIDLDGLADSLPATIQQLGGTIWVPDYRDLRRVDVDDAHALGLKVIVWTVNETDAMQAMLAMGVDGLITDYPDLGRGVIDAWIQSK